MGCPSALLRLLTLTTTPSHHHSHKQSRIPRLTTLTLTVTLPSLTVNKLAGLEVGELGLHHGAPVRHNQPVLGLVHLEELQGHHLADVILRQALRRVRSGKEATQTLPPSTTPVSLNPIP